MNVHSTGADETSTVLLVDDEQHIADVVVYALEEHRFRTVTALDGDQGLAQFRRESPALVLLDLNLPGLSGLDLFAIMRRERPRQPIIMLTSRSEELDRVLGLELGADDYVTKPFSPRELVARVRAVLRRAGASPTDGDDVLVAGPLRLDEAAFTLTVGGQPIPLTRPEFQLMAHLLRHPAHVFTRDILVRHLYDDSHPVTDRSIDATVKRLRRKVQESRPGLDPIESVYGVGYKLRHGLEDPR